MVNIYYYVMKLTKIVQDVLIVLLDRGQFMHVQRGSFPFNLNFILLNFAICFDVSAVLVNKIIYFNRYLDFFIHILCWFFLLVNRLSLAFEDDNYHDHHYEDDDQDQHSHKFLTITWNFLAFEVIFEARWEIVTIAFQLAVLKAAFIGISVC